jgi:Fe-Mn family superoxide dismutase
MFTLIQLPYAENALEPVISAQTISFHHGKHLQAYVDNLNKLLPGTPWEGLSLEEIVIATAPTAAPAASLTAQSAAPAPAANATAVFNNAGQILNHNLYFTQFRPVAGSTNLSKGKKGLPLPEAQAKALSASRLPGPDPASPLVKQILKQWGTLDAFKDDFVAKGVGLFGSGWVWLAAAPDGTLVITQEPGAGNPVTRTIPGQTGRLRPILTFDVWEHAYYLDFQNRRAAHLQALWQILDWTVLESRYSG